MTTYGASRAFGPISRKEKPVGNEFLTTLNSALSGSPLGVGTSEVVLNIPDNCVEVILCGDASFYYSEVTGMANYFTVPADTVVAIGVAQMTALYVKSAAGTCNLSYKWVLI